MPSDPDERKIKKFWYPTGQIRPLGADMRGWMTISHELLGGSGGAACGRGRLTNTAPLIAPFLAIVTPIFAPVLTVIPTFLAAFLTLFAPFFAALHSWSLGRCFPRR